jgi:hypothetical protein
VEPLRPITEILPFAPTDPNSGRQHQRLPFTQGQLLQGLVNARTGPQQFTIDIGGLQVAAESTTPLQVGQKLDLQVTALAPNVELQIVQHNPINQRISASLHLLGQQATTLPTLPDLAAAALDMPDLSAASQKTLQLFARALAPLPGGSTATPLTMIAQLVDKATTAAAAWNSNSAPSALNAEISGLLKQLAASPGLPPQLAEQAATLAAAFAPVQEQPTADRLTASLETIATPASPGPGAQPQQPSPEPDKIPNTLIMQVFFQQLTTTLQQSPSLPANHPLRQLLAFLTTAQNISAGGSTGSTESTGSTGSTGSIGSTGSTGGQQLETVANRLGMNLERVLAANKREEAVQTLKFALMEWSQQAPTNEKHAVQADQLVKTIELYQLLQMRLAGESVAFQPLPFSFLQQGFLLVDADQAKNQENGNQGEKAAPKVALHLQLEGLGNMEIDIHQENGRIAVRFLSEDAERAHYLSGFREELAQWLTAGRLESVQFLTGAKDPTKVLLEKLVHGPTGMIDARA